jgi:hypothetical protein
MTVDYSKAVFFVKLTIVNYSKAVSVCAIKSYGEVQYSCCHSEPHYLMWVVMALINLSAMLYNLSSYLG